MFSETLNRVIQGAGTHAPLRMTPVRKLDKTYEDEIPVVIKQNYCFVFLKLVS